MATLSSDLRSNLHPNLYQRTYAATLFDMDGTLISSIAATERVWAAWARRHGLDVETFLPTIHGIRAVETVRRLQLPGVDPEVEAAALLQAELDDIDGVEAIAGAARFLDTLPEQRWAIVTSAPRALALLRLEAAGLPLPSVLISAEDVANGKPAPDCFQLAARRLAVDVRDCLVFEDAPAGIQAAETAGASVVVVTAIHQSPVADQHSTIADYTGLFAQAEADGGTRIKLKE